MRSAIPLDSMSRDMVRAVALVSSIVLSSSTAGADSSRVAADALPRVAIVPGIAVNLDTARVDALSQDLAEALNQELEVEAIGGLEVRRLLPPEGLPPDCVTTPKCTAEVGKRTKSTQLLFVVMVDSGSGGTIQVDSTWADPATGRTASRPAIDLTSAAEAKSKFASMAHQLLPDAKVREKTVGGIDAKMSEGVPRHFTVPSLITAGVGVVALGISVGFAIDSSSKFSTCKNNVYDCTQADRDAIRDAALIADVAGAIALGGAVATVVMYMTSAKEAHVIVEPTPGGGAAASWFGRF